MAPRTWHNEAQRAFFSIQMPIFLHHQKRGKLYKFWEPMFAEFFLLFPEQKVLGLALPTDKDAPPLTPDQFTLLGAAIDKRRSQLLNYFRNNCGKLSAPGAKNLKSRNSLAKLLFKAKPARRRLHKALEIFQIRNNAVIREECARQGHDLLNEATVSQTVEGWVDEDDAVQVARVKADAAARMQIRLRVVNALFTQASPEESAAIAAVMAREKAGEPEPDVEVDENGVAREPPSRSPTEYQASIDESWEVIKRVHQILGELTGWNSFTMWGGPNPSLGGELSMKSICSGLTPAGHDFESSHPAFEPQVVLPFQIYLGKCFPPSMRHERALPVAAPVQTETLQATFRLPNGDVAAPPKPKRVRKPKKAKTSAPSAPSLPVPPAPAPPPTAVPAPAAGAPNSTAAPLPPAAAPASNADVPMPPPSEPAPTFMLRGDGDGLESFDFGMDDGDLGEFGTDGMDAFGMPPLPSGQWLPAPRSTPSNDGVMSPPPAHLYLGSPESNDRGAANDSEDRIRALFDRYRSHADASPTRQGAGGRRENSPSPRGAFFGTGVAPVQSSGAAGDFVTPAAGDTGAVAPSSTPMATAPLVFPQSRPPANLPPSPKPAKKTAGKTRKGAGKGKGKKAVAGTGLTAEGKASGAAKVAAKRGAAAAKKKAPVTVAEESSSAAAALADSTNVPPALVYTMGNETRDFNRGVDARRAAAAAEARERPIENSWEGTGVVTVSVPKDVPMPPRETRTRKRTTFADNTELVLPVKLTRTELAAARARGETRVDVVNARTRGELARRSG
ncbi:hypothetical protein DFH06DRAFT_1325023 [Mycena polygramma]|nr:hypothetical protein DFH06DRAFT_1325023 [Mycena polygramma]